MFSFLVRILKKKRNLFLLNFLGFIFFIIFISFSQLEFFKTSFLYLYNESFLIYLKTFFLVFREILFGFSFLNILFTVVLSLLLSLNFILLSLLYKKQKIVFKSKSFASSLAGIFLGFFGIGCISCGAFVLAPLLAFLGLGAYVNYFVQNMFLISILSLVLLVFSNIYLLYQIKKPLVCK